ncbi:MAG: protein kinase [Rhodobacterales bacterium]|nr:protein kinase [Rhodobacterales bacterium]
MDLVPGSLVDRYRVESRIGSGRMSTTYTVRHTVLDTLHAFTVANAHSKSLRKRMVNGAKIQASLRHPHVISATDVFDVEGLPAVVIDHVEGPNLEQFVASHEMDQKAIDAIAWGLFEGLSCLHNRSIVHRHLKPRNIMVDLGGNVAVPKIHDFTLSKVLGTHSRKRAKPRIFGTPQFMSPEQTYDSDNVDHRSDIWSLGCLLYFICTGNPPFDGTSAEVVFKQVRKGEYPALTARFPDAPGRWGDAIQQALTIDVNSRCATAQDLANAWFAGSSERPAMVAKSAPVGRIALVFTDIQGSTSLWERDEELTRHSLRAHDAVMRACLHRHGGYEVKTEGDAFMIAFRHANQAVSFCLDVQRDLAEHPWAEALLAMPEVEPEPGFRGLRVRMGVHVGEPEARARGDRVDYFGPFVNRAARIASAGHGGQILVSTEAWKLANGRIPEEPAVSNLGTFDLRGLSDYQEMLQVLPKEFQARRFAPLKAQQIT